MLLSLCGVEQDVMQKVGTKTKLADSPIQNILLCHFFNTIMNEVYTIVVYENSMALPM
jgi:hypothetical protein